MTTDSPDSVGFVPPLPTSIPGVDPSLPGLSIAGPAGAGPFRVEGARGCVSGHQRSPIGRVEFYGVGVVDDFRMGADRAANLVVFPGMARRDFIGREGLYVETIVIAPDLPLVVVTRDGGAGRPGGPSFSFRLSLHADGTGESPGQAESAVSVTADGAGLVSADGAGIAIGVTPAPHRLDVVREGDRCVRVTVTAGPSGPLSLVLSGGSSREVRTAFGAAAHLKGHVIRAATGPVEGGLSTSSGVREIDDGVGWLKARVHRRLDRLAARGAPTNASDGADIHDALMLGLAAIAVADRKASERVLTMPLLTGTAERALLAGRHASTFGDVTFAADIARRWAEPLPHATDHSEETVNADDDGMWELAGRILSDGLLHAAADDVRDGLKRPRSRPGGTGDPRGANSGESGGRALPMAGPRPARAPRATRLEALLAGEPLAGEGSERRPGAPHTLSALFRRDPAAAWNEWRQLIARGLEEGPAGPGSWAEARREPISAELLLAFACGMLGIVPDAPAGRIRLAPRVPSHLTAFTVHGITVGEVAFTLLFERDANRHVYTLRPQLAAVPPYVVFEAAVPGGPGEVMIDGVRAELEPRQEGGSTIYPLQFALDAARTVEITSPGPVAEVHPPTTM